MHRPMSVSLPEKLWVICQRKKEPRGFSWGDQSFSVGADQVSVNSKSGVEIGEWRANEARLLPAASLLYTWKVVFLVNSFVGSVIYEQNLTSGFLYRALSLTMFLYKTWEIKTCSSYLKRKYRPISAVYNISEKEVHIKQIHKLKGRSPTQKKCKHANPRI